MVPSELGAFLTRSREEKGLTLEDIESRTHIRKKYLVALEAGDWDSLPPGVYTRGLLRSYAKALGVSEQSVSRYYAKERPQEAKLPEPQLISQPLVDEPRYSNELILAVAGFALAGVLLVWLVKTEFGPLLDGAVQLLASGQESSPPTSTTPEQVAGTPSGVIKAVPLGSPATGRSGTSSTPRGPLASTDGAAGSVSPNPLSTAGTTAVPSPTGGTPAATGTAPASTGTAPASTGTAPSATGTSRAASTAVAGALRMSVTATGRVWLRVIADGEEIYTGFMQLGDQESWGADQAVEIRTGNAGGTDVTLNGKKLAPLGPEGIVLTCTWRLLPDGAIEQSC